MSVRSSRPSTLPVVLVGLLAGGCGKHEAPQKKGDVVHVKTWAASMVDNVPRPGAAPECGPGDFVGGYPMTHLTLLKIGGKTYKSDKPEYADWINPIGLDAPSARVLIDDKASKEDKEAAAGEFQAAKFFVVYRVDNVDAPIALGVKDIKMSTVAARVVKYGPNTIPICTSVFLFQNSKDKYEWASEHSDKPIVPPEVTAAIREDLTARYLELAPSVKPGGAATPPKR